MEQTKKREKKKDTPTNKQKNNIWMGGMSRSPETNGITVFPNHFISNTGRVITILKGIFLIFPRMHHLCTLAVLEWMSDVPYFECIHTVHWIPIGESWEVLTEPSPCYGLYTCCYEDF